MARLEQVLKGAKREFAKKSPGKRERLPITPDILLKLKVLKTRKNYVMGGVLSLLLWLPKGRRANSALRGHYDKGVHLNMEDMAVDRISSPSIV